MDTPGGIIYLLQHIGTSLQRQYDQALMEQLGISTSQYRVLVMLKNQPELQQRQIAASLGQTEASISRQVGLMADKGLIRTYDHPASKREHVTELTAKGDHVADAAKDLYEKMSAPLVEALNQRQVRSLQDGINKVHEMTCNPRNLKSCDHRLEILDNANNAAYLTAIS